MNGTNTYAASCQEYFDLGNRVGGTFKIRPNLLVPPFTVECEFNNGQGFTLIKPKDWKAKGYIFPPNEDYRCEHSNCFMHNFEYETTLSQIEVLILISQMLMRVKTQFQALSNASLSCTQSIKHTCIVNSLTTFSSWTGRDGIVRKYWSGDGNSSDTGCQCGIDETCTTISNLNLICNCDSRGVNVIDDGILSDKDSLPVMSLRYGGAFTRISSIKYILGPFICSGKAQPYPSEKSDIDQEQMKNQLNALTDKVNDMETKKETVIAFRVIQVETDQVSSQLALNISPGKRSRFPLQITCDKI